MKRTISIILSLALVLMAVAVPALAADELTDPGPSVYNFLDSTGYYRYQTLTEVYESSHRSFAASYETTALRLNGFSWCPILGDYTDMDLDVEPSKNGELMRVKYLTYVFYSSVEVQNVFINFYDEIAELRSVKGTEIGTKLTYETIDVGYYYTYTFHIDMTIFTAFSFDITFTDEEQSFEFESVALYRDNYYKRIMPNTNILVEGRLYNRSDNSYYLQEIYAGSNFNIDSYHLDNSSSDFPSDGRIHVHLDFDQYSYIGADKFTISIITTGIFDNYYDYGSAAEAGLTVVDATGNYYNIPISTYFSKMAQASYYGQEAVLVTFTADLSSYNLTDSMLNLNFVVNSRQPYENNDFAYFWFEVANQFFYFGYEENYNEEDRFFERLTQWWYVNVGRFLNTGFGYIVTGFDLALAHLEDHVTNELEDLWGNLDNKFDDLFEKLDKYFGVPEDTAPPDSSDQQEDIEDSIGEMDGIADQFGTAGDQIEQLLPDTPNYNDTGLADNADLAVTNISYVLMVFNPLWENEFIITVLTFSCMLALGGFILFGER